MEKLCPLRKLIFHYNNGEEVENFMPCMEKECMWYNAEQKKCSVVKNNEKSL